jgi:phage gp36-like protein
LYGYVSDGGKYNIMGYIIQNDYLKQIQPALLNQVTGNNAAVLSSAEQAAEAEIRSYLANRYDIDSALAETTAWDDSAAYKAGNRVYDDSNVLYHAKYPFGQFQLQGNYKPGDKVWWRDRSYECRIATSYLGHEGNLQRRTVQNIPAANVFPDNSLIGTQYWTDLGAYQIVAGTMPGNNTYWTQGDSRNPQLLMYAIDIVLYHVHSRIAPNNIPQLRQTRYAQTISWLQKVANGEVIADLPVLQTPETSRIRFGGNVKNINSY